MPTPYTTTAPAGMPPGERCELATTSLENARRTGDQEAIEKAEAWLSFCRRQVEAAQARQGLAAKLDSLTPDEYHRIYA